MYKKDKLKLKINEFVAENGTDTVMDKQQILTLAEMYDCDLKPTDYCYNYINGRISDNYLSQPHLFEYVSWNRFRILGEDYPYSGDAVKYYRSKDKEPEIFGKWAEGKFVLK